MAHHRRKRARALDRRTADSNYWWPKWYRDEKVMRERARKRERESDIADARPACEGDCTYCAG